MHIIALICILEENEQNKIKQNKYNKQTNK